MFTGDDNACHKATLSCKDPFRPTTLSTSFEVCQHIVELLIRVNYIGGGPYRGQPSGATGCIETSKV